MRVQRVLGRRREMVDGVRRAEAALRREGSIRRAAAKEAKSDVKVCGRKRARGEKLWIHRNWIEIIIQLNHRFDRLDLPVY